MTGVNSLIREIFLEDRSGETSYQFVYEASKYLLKWAFDNELGLIFVAVYPAILNNQSLAIIEKILGSAQSKFTSLWKQSNTSTLTHQLAVACEFDKVYDAIVDRFENARSKQRVQRSFNETKKGLEKKKPNEAELAKIEKKQKKAEEKAKKAEENLDQREAKKQAMLEKLGRRGRSGPGPMRKKKKTSIPKKSSKKKRNWNNDLTEEEKQALDHGEGNDTEDAENKQFEQHKAIYMPEGSIEFGDTDDEEEEDGKDNKSSSGFFSFFKSLAGQKPLTEEDLDPVLSKVKSQLMSKNVAVDIAEKICDSVCTVLVGRVVGTFGSVKSMVKEAVEKALTRILTPKRVINILPDIQAAKRKGRPYVIVFIGVNGVGKSTSLAKVCAYLQSKGLSVSIAACDTFRSGAVEQLRTHSKCLTARLFEKGYNRDAAGVAADAIAQAKTMKDDVVLVDTAGRMQDNAPLMRALAKLVAVNRPDLVLFVGEALVGNDAVDQVTRFNQALAEYSTASNPRLIDGMVLTKFDTIDDKVGAAISLTYVTGKPIIFVGTGQTYSDLKRVNVKMLIRMLLR